MAEAESLPKFTGELERQLDSGLRVMLPKDWRSSKPSEYFLVADSSSSFIKVFPGPEYDKYIARLEANTALDEEARNLELENIGSNSWRIHADKSDRLALPPPVCARIGIGEKNPTVLLMGAVRTFNIWNPARRKSRKAELQKSGEPVAVASVKKHLGI